MILLTMMIWFPEYDSRDDQFMKGTQEIRRDYNQSIFISIDFYLQISMNSLLDLLFFVRFGQNLISLLVTIEFIPHLFD